MILVDIKATGFLYGMVRLNVGLFFPLNTDAISVASLPSVLSFASTKNQFLSMVSKDGVIVLFIYQIYANKFKVNIKFYLIGGILNNSFEWFKQKIRLIKLYLRKTIN